jgi:uncharacterized C2H2 Zn-finger protein
MKVSWKEVRLFGFGIAIPVIAFLATQLAEHEMRAFRQRKESLADCERCKKLFHIRAGMSFIMHLQDKHGFTSDESIDIVADLYKQMLKWRKASQ